MSEKNDIEIVWFGHSCFRMKIRKQILYFDPIRKNNLLGTTLVPQNEKGVSSIFISHDHWDHCDANTIIQLFSPNNQIYCPLPVAGLLSLAISFEVENMNEHRKIMEKISPIKKGDIIDKNGVRVKCLEASEGLSYLVIHDRKKLLFMGDSIVTNEMIKEGPDVILFPIWAVSGKEAKLEEFLELVDGRVCIPMHYHVSADALPQFNVNPIELQELQNVRMQILEKGKIYWV